MLLTLSINSQSFSLTKILFSCKIFHYIYILGFNFKKTLSEKSRTNFPLGSNNLPIPQPPSTPQPLLVLGLITFFVRSYDPL